jgi:AraC-like DNA-binding protein
LSADGPPEDFHYFAESPSPELTPFVDCYWGVRGSLGVLGYRMESVLPTGTVELMVNFGSRQRIVAYGERDVDEAFDTAWLSGMHDQRLVHCAEGYSDHISIRFRPGGAHAFLDLPLDALTNHVVILEDLVGSDADALRDELAAASGDVARCRILDRWLVDRRRGVHPYYRTVRRAADLLRGGARALGVAEVCDRLGLSNRYLIRQFRVTIGLTPKTFARVERFRGMIDDLRGVDDPAWARLAARHGYSDQSHLIRDFHRFALLTPTEFLVRRTPDQANAVADEPTAPHVPGL